MINCNRCGRFVGKDGYIETDEDHFIWSAICGPCNHKRSKADTAKHTKLQQERLDRLREMQERLAQLQEASRC